MIIPNQSKITATLPSGQMFALLRCPLNINSRKLHFQTLSLIHNHLRQRYEEWNREREDADTHVRMRVDAVDNLGVDLQEMSKRYQW